MLRLAFFFCCECSSINNARLVQRVQVCVTLRDPRDVDSTGCCLVQPLYAGVQPHLLFSLEHQLLDLSGKADFNLLVRARSTGDPGDYTLRGLHLLPPLLLLVERRWHIDQRDHLR